MATSTENKSENKSNGDLLHEIMENISDAFVALDNNWFYVYVNEKAANMFGRKPEDLIGKHIWTEFPEGVDQKFYHAYYDAKKRNEAIQIEEYYPPWDRWFENRIQPYKGGLLIFFQDITNRKLREFEISTMNSVLTESQHLGKMGTWVYNIEKKNGWLSTTFYELLGYLKTDHELTLSDFISFVHEKDKHRIEKLIRLKLIKPRNFCTEFRIVDKAGTIKYLKTEAKLYYNHLGKPERLIGIILDITESELDKRQVTAFNKELGTRVRQRTKELEIAKSNLQALIENTRDGIWSINKDRVLMIFNSAFNKSYHIVTGRNMKEGEKLEKLLDPILHKEHYEYWDRLLKRVLKGEQISDKYTIRLGDRTMTYLVSCHPIIHRNKINGATFFSKDITKIIENEKSMIHLNNELKQKVNEMKVINDDLNSFTYTVSHDLRAPLRAINGYSEMLSNHLKDTLSDDDRQLISRILANAAKMEQLIQDLLAFSRFSKKDVSRAELNMKALVRSVSKEVTDDMGKEIGIIHVKEHVPAFADYALISQVYYNLLSNAVKFSSKNEKPVIEAGSMLINGETVYYVRDNGVGFDMKYADKIFNVFQRLHTEAEFEGTGVGLAIVKRIISKHGGRLWVESKKNEGTTFFFSLPEKEEISAAANSEETA